MKIKQYNNEIVEKIKSIFFDKFPNQFKDIDIASNALIKAIQKQNANTVFDINYVILIQDTATSILPNIADIINAETPKERHDEILHLNRIFLNSLVSEYIQDGNNTPHEKLELLYFYLNIIKVYKEVYMIEVVKDQSGFIEYLERNYNEQETLAEEFDELIRQIDKGKDEDKLNISHTILVWHDHTKIERITRALYERDIIKSKNSFKTFLKGDTNEIEVSLEKIEVFALLVHNLKNNQNAFEIRKNNKGYKGFFKHFEKHIKDYSNNPTIIPMTKIVSKIRKDQNSYKPIISTVRSILIDCKFSNTENII